MLELNLQQLPQHVKEIPSPPAQLFYRGANLLELLKLPRLAVVGSRAMTPYGQQITQAFVKPLAEQGMVIISGLAYGVDATAHEIALESGGLTIAVLPSPVDNILPAAHRDLANRILGQGGAIVSEYPPGTHPVKQNFIARNRLMSGLAKGVLVTEAGEKSGALYTARFGNDQGRDVMAVPGNINHANSVGCNNLIKAGEAHVVTSYKDVLSVLGLHDHATHIKQVRGRNRNEQAVLDLMLQGVSEGDQLLRASGLDIVKFNQVLSMLEIGGKIRPLGANNWTIF